MESVYLNTEDSNQPSTVGSSLHDSGSSGFPLELHSDNSQPPVNGITTSDEHRPTGEATVL